MSTTTNQQVDTFIRHVEEYLRLAPQVKSETELLNRGGGDWPTSPELVEEYLARLHRVQTILVDVPKIGNQLLPLLDHRGKDPTPLLKVMTLIEAERHEKAGQKWPYVKAALLAIGLENTGPVTGPAAKQRPKSKTPKKRGPIFQSDQQADEKLRDDWNAAKRTGTRRYKDFARARGMTEHQVRTRLERARVRKAKAKKGSKPAPE